MPSTLTDKLNAAFGRFQNRDGPGTEQLCNEILRESPGHPDALHLLGVLRIMTGDPAAAAGLLRRSLEVKAGDASTHEHLGIALLATGDGAAAEAALAQAQVLGANHAQLHMRLGLALAAQGKFAAAVASLRTAAAREPGDLDILLNLGNTLAQHGQFEDALATYEKMLQIEPDNPLVCFNLGNLYRSMERLDEAASAYNKALAKAPDDADTHNNLGLVYQRQQRLEEAAGHYQRALALDAGHTHARNNLGNVLRAQGKLDEAVACYEQVLQREPDHADACVNLGNARAGQGRYAEAQALYERALQADPGSFEAHYNLGRLLNDLGRTQDAIAHYRQAIAADSKQAIAHRDLGAAQLQTGDIEAAVASQRAALELDPGDSQARYVLAESLKLQGRLDEAVALYQQALELQPDHLPALNGLLHVRQHMCSWDGIAEQWDRLRGGLAADGQVSPFSILSLPSTAAEQLTCAAAWARKQVAPFAGARAGLGSSGRAASSRLRVGYLSWGFHRHATAHLTAELFELHDRGRFEVHAYAYGPDDGSEIRARIRNACDRFVDIAQESHLQAARRIHDDGVDILVDLTGYTLGTRPQILALRPAPVQVNWLGYPGTLGTDCIDYIVADPYIIPEGQEPHYAEKVVRLPNCYQINDRKREVAERTPTREECGLPQEGFVFCCFNQAYKILPDTFALWMRILHAVPHSVLWLADANRWATENLRRAATASGVPAERLVFAARKPLPEYLAAYRVADLALDTFPYGSHTTASDALWMGCPLITRTGSTFAARVAGSILTSAGLARCVAATPEEYERMAIELATTDNRLAALRREVQAARTSSPLFDTPLLVRNLEAAYERMVGPTRTGRGA